MSAEAPRILVVDDDEALLKTMERALRAEGLGQPVLCRDPREAPGIVAAGDIGVVLLDLVMPHCSGEELLPMLLAKAPEASVIIVTATDQADTAVRCIKAGAFDYLVKPVNLSRLVSDVVRAMQQRNLRVENRELREAIRRPELKRPEVFARIATASPAMLAALRHVEAVAPSPEPVLIVGETGVGKELVAEALHRASGLRGNLVPVNVAGLDDSTFADTLFGHVRGAFTGAERDRDGLILKAGEGSLFLDEIGDLGVEMQTKLLRLVQEREFFPIGSDRCVESRCRVIAATNRDLRQRMREGRFREDLYYRLQSHLVRVPPLRERVGDIPLLVAQFMKEAATAFGKPVPTQPKELFVHLSAYAFPGNVRELRSMVMDAVARHEKGVLSLETFHEHMDRSGVARSPYRDLSGLPISLPGQGELPTLRAAARLLVDEAVKRAGGNQGAAARMLGVSRRTISRYLAGEASDDDTEYP